MTDMNTDSIYEEGVIDSLKNSKLNIQRNVVARYNDTSGKAILRLANDYNSTIAKLDEDEKKAMSDVGSGKYMTSKELAHHKHVLERYLARCQSYAGKLWKYDKLIKKGGVISKDITGVYEQTDKAIRGKIRLLENLIKKCDTISTYDDSSKKDPFSESVDLDDICLEAFASKNKDGVKSPDDAYRYIAQRLKRLKSIMSDDNASADDVKKAWNELWDIDHKFKKDPYLSDRDRQQIQNQIDEIYEIGTGNHHKTKVEKYKASFTKHYNTNLENIKQKKYEKLQKRTIKEVNKNGVKFNQSKLDELKRACDEYERAVIYHKTKNGKYYNMDKVRAKVERLLDECRTNLEQCTDLDTASINKKIDEYNDAVDSMTASFSTERLAIVSGCIGVGKKGAKQAKKNSLSKLSHEEFATKNNAYHDKYLDLRTESVSVDSVFSEAFNFEEDPYDDSYEYYVACRDFVNAYKEYDEAMSIYEPLNSIEEYVIETAANNDSITDDERLIVEKHEKNEAAIKKSNGALAKMKKSLSSAMDSASKSIFSAKKGLTHRKNAKNWMPNVHKIIKSNPHIANTEIDAFDFKGYYQSFSKHIERLIMMCDFILVYPNKYPNEFGTVSSWEKKYPELFEETDGKTVDSKYAKKLKLKDALKQLEFDADVTAVEVDRDFPKFRDHAIEWMSKIGVDPDTVKGDGTIPNENEIAKAYVSACMLIFNSYVKFIKIDNAKSEEGLKILTTTITNLGKKDGGSDDDSDTTESVDLGTMLNMSRSPIGGHI